MLDARLGLRLLALLAAVGCGVDGDAARPTAQPGASEAPESAPDPAPRGEPRTPEPDMSDPDPTKTPDSIGSASMKDDGTLVLRLRAEAEDGTVGEGYFTYAPDHAEYATILEHVGPLKPGEETSVRPWPTP